MSPAPAVPAVLTVVFALTGVLALREYARVVATPVPAARPHTVTAATAPAPVEARAAAVLHLLMSVAMIAMAWGLAGGPGTASGRIQLIVFGGFALGFGVAAALRAPARPTRSFHALTALAMVWMVAAMPSLMGTGGQDRHGGHDTAGMSGMAGMAGMDMSGTHGASPGGSTAVGPAPAWVLGLTGLLVAVLLVVAVLWFLAMVRHAPARVALATALPAGTRCGSSWWACCHVLMSGGMAAMLATML